MTTWLAVSDGAGPKLPPGADLAEGLLVFDLALPMTATTVLLDHTEADATLSLIYTPDFGFGLLHRRGNAVRRQMLRGGRAGGNGTALLTFAWQASGIWSLRLSDAAGEVTAEGSGALPLPRALLAGACARARLRAPALLWFGVTPGAPVRPLALLGPRTPLATPGGPVAAAILRAGNMVLTRDHGPRPIRAVTRHALPATGSFAPIRLRAPFFGAPGDVLVSPVQRIAMSGVEVEYLFGKDEVLVEARHLADGSHALIEGRRATLPWIALDLGQDALLLSGECTLAVGPGHGLPRIDGFEARALQAMRRKGASRFAA